MIGYNLAVNEPTHIWIPNRLRLYKEGLVRGVYTKAIVQNIYFSHHDAIENHFTEEWSCFHC